MQKRHAVNMSLSESDGKSEDARLIACMLSLRDHGLTIEADFLYRALMRKKSDDFDRIRGSFPQSIDGVWAPYLDRPAHCFEPGDFLLSDCSPLQPRRWAMVGCDDRLWILIYVGLYPEGDEALFYNPFGSADDNPFLKVRRSLLSHAFPLVAIGSIDGDLRPVPRFAFPDWERPVVREIERALEIRNVPMPFIQPTLKSETTLVGPSPSMSIH